MLEVHFLTLELEHAASHDKLTGLHTRASFYDKLEQTGLFPCAVVVADIDYFKKINDAHGHRGGDQALQHFSTTLVCNCREDDIVARFGGEEFVIVLRNSTLENGLDVAQRLCERIRSKKLCFDHKVIEITASFGVSTAHDLSDIDSSIHLADLALYRAKRAGRNRVFAYDPSLDDTSAGSIAKHDQPCHAPISLASNG